MGASNVVYYVEDDKNIRELTVYALGQGGIEAKGCADDAEFRRACAERKPDAVLLDIMLPDADGLEILSRIRKMPGLSNVPVMMLTAKDTELDKVRALDGGADDYLSKPFGMMEMVSRTRALLRRAGRESEAAESACCSAGPVTARSSRLPCASSTCSRSSSSRRASCSPARPCSNASGAGISTAGRGRLMSMSSRYARSWAIRATSSRPSAASDTACAAKQNLRRVFDRRLIYQ